MKKRLLPTLCLSALLAACSGGGGGSNNNNPSPTPVPQAQGNNQVKPDNKPESNPEKPADKPMDNVNQGKPVQPEQPVLPMVDNKPAEPEKPTDKPIDNANQGKPVEPEQPNVKPEEPKVEPKPEQPVPPMVDNKPGESGNPVEEPKDSKAVKYIGHGESQSSGDIEWNKNRDEITVYEISAKEDEYNNNTKYTRTEKTIQLKSDTMEGSHEFYVLGDNAYYGAFSDVDQLDKYGIGAGQFKTFVRAADEKLIAKDVSTSLNAKYYKNNGFLYGATGKNRESDPNLVGRGDIDIQITKGHITGTVNEKDSDETLFNIKGDVASLAEQGLEVAPADGINKPQYGVTARDKAVFNADFVNSNENSNDQKYFIGNGRADGWIGVFGAERDTRDEK